MYDIQRTSSISAVGNDAGRLLFLMLDIEFRMVVSHHESASLHVLAASADAPFGLH